MLHLVMSPMPFIAFEMPSDFLKENVKRLEEKTA